jgi:small subunit ribosomal protein S13
MPRIAGVNIPENKRIEIALTYIYGIGRSLSREVLKETGIDLSVRAEKLTQDEINKLRDAIDKKGYKIEGDLRRGRMMDVKRLKDLGCWRGMRHIKGLPTRGQQTQTNSRTVRGNVRRTVGSGRKAAPAPK